LNDDTQTTTRCITATSFTASTGIQSVVVRVPQNVAGGVLGVLMQNTSNATDGLAQQGIRVHLLGAFGLEASLIRYLNSDLSNGLMFAVDGTSVTEQQYGIAVDGAFFIPCYLAKGGDIQLEIDFDAGVNGDTYTFTPIMVSSLGGNVGQETRSTQSAPSNTAKSVLQRTLE
jgi:hypothetical protein